MENTRITALLNRDEFYALQEKALPYSIAPVSGGYRMIGNKPEADYLPIDKPLNKATLKEWQDQYAEKLKNAKIPTVGLLCGQVVENSYGSWRVAVIDIDTVNEHPLEKWLQINLPKMGVYQRLKKTGEVIPSKIVRKRGSKGTSYIILVPKDFHRYDRYFKGAGEFEMEKSEGHSAELLMFDKAAKKDWQGSGNNQTNHCYVEGAHKSGLEKNRYRWLDECLWDIDPDHLPMWNKLWEVAAHMFNDERLKVTTSTLKADFTEKFLEAITRTQQTDVGSFHQLYSGENCVMTTWVRRLMDYKGEENRNAPTEREILDFLQDHAYTRWHNKVRSGEKRQDELLADIRKDGGKQSIENTIEWCKDHLKKDEPTMSEFNDEVGGGKSGKKRGKKKVAECRTIADIFTECVGRGDPDNFLTPDGVNVFVYNENGTWWQKWDSIHLHSRMVDYTDNTTPNARKDACDIVAKRAFLNPLSTKYRRDQMKRDWTALSNFTSLKGLHKLNPKTLQYEYIEAANVTREDLVTLFLPYEYMQGATLEEIEATCPGYMKVLNHLFDGRKDKISLLLEHIALMLTRCRTPQAALFVAGAAGTGKSILCDGINELFQSSDYEGASVIDTCEIKKLSNENSINRLVGKRGNIVSEGGNVRLTVDEILRFKQIVGATDKSENKKLYVDTSATVIDPVCLFFGNHFPNFGSLDDPDSIDRRVIYMESTSNMIDQRPVIDAEGNVLSMKGDVKKEPLLGLQLKSKEELSGLFNLLVYHLQNIMRRQAYHLPEDVRNRSKDSGDEIQLIDSFFDWEHCPFERHDSLDKSNWTVTNYEVYTQIILFARYSPLFQGDKWISNNRIQREYANYAQRNRLPATERGGGKNPQGTRNRLMPFRYKKDAKILELDEEYQNKIKLVERKLPEGLPY